MMKFIVFLLVGVAVAACSQRSEQTVPADEPQDEFWGHRYYHQANIPYGDDPAQRLDIISQGQWVGEPDYWIPDPVKHPTVINIHGGGWLGSLKEEETPFYIEYLRKGWNVVNLEYRMGAGTAPQAVDDCMCAIKWATEHADQYNIDLSNVIITGGSAGGHLALITGLLNSVPDSHPCHVSDEIRIKAVVNWFGITDIAKVAEYLRESRPDGNYADIWMQGLDVATISAENSPVHFVTENAPPVITIHGESDTVVPFDQAVILHERLDEAGVRNELVSFADGKHLGFTHEQFSESWQRIFNFLDLD